MAAEWRIKMKQIQITRNDAGQRLDKFLTKFMPSLPKSMLYKSLRKNCVRINGRHVRDGAYVLSEGEELSLYFNDEFFTRREAHISENDNISVVYEDENILVVNKPTNLVVHADDRGSTDTLVSRVQSYLYKKGEYDPQSEHSFSPALCNRLDRNTSGLVIAAKNAAALRIINEKLKNREIKKYYMCVTEGLPPHESGLLQSSVTRENKRTSIGKDGKEIRTKYRLIKSVGSRALLEIELLTGRTHQIRVQMSAVGCPLEGDVKYGAKRRNGGYSLCSFKLVFDFSSDAGELNYLNGKEITINPPFSL